MSLLLVTTCAYSNAQKIFNDDALLEIRKLIDNREHDKADSILDLYEKEGQNDGNLFLLNLSRCLNGYFKIRTTQDISVIRPYAEAGRKAFMFISTNFNKENATSANALPMLVMYAEIFNYLQDSIMVDIEKFADKCYHVFNMHDFSSFYEVQKNIYQYYMSLGDFNRAAKSMISIYKAGKEECDTTLYLPISAANVGEAYYYMKDYQEAEKWLILSHDKFKAFNNKTSAFYCKMLENLVYSIVFHDNNYTKAYDYAKEFCEENKFLNGEFSPEYLDALAKLGTIEMNMGKIDIGISNLEKVVGMLDKVPNIDEEKKRSYITQLYIMNMYMGRDVDFSKIQLSEYPFLNAYYYFQNGEYDQAIPLLKHYITTFENSPTDLDPYYVEASGYLSLIYSKQGEYAKADSILNHAINVMKRTGFYKEETDDFYEIYMAKGFLNASLYNIDEALKWYDLASSTFNENYRNTSSYARVLSNMAICYGLKGDFNLSKEYNEKAYAILVNYLGDNISYNSELLLELNNTACSYANLYDFEKAKELLGMVIENAIGEQNEDVKGLAYSNLSLIFLFEGNYEMAEKIIDTAKKLKYSSFHKKNTDFYHVIVKCLRGDEKAISLVEQFNNDQKNNIVEVFSKFSESEREDYWYQHSRKLLYCNNLAAATFKSSDITIDAFDNILFTKGMLINSNKIFETAIKKSNDQSLIKDYGTIRSIKEKFSSKDANIESLPHLIDSIRTIEKRIVKSIPDFQQKLFSQFCSFNDVKKMLYDKEFAIEFTLIPHFAFPLEKTEYYLGAFIIDKDCESPTLVELCANNDVYNICKSDSISTIDRIDSIYNISDTRLYQMLWKKIEPFINDGSTVYYSPSGAINSINIPAISDGNIRLSEKYSFCEVSTTANIQNIKNYSTISPSAVLYGDINYFESLDVMSNNSRSYKSFSSGDILATRSLSRGAWDLLPGTIDEINSIGKIMEDLNITHVIYSNDKASEESFKSMDGKAPAIIHISTHGYYYPLNKKNISPFFNNSFSNTKKDLSMFRSGLLFAGANNAWVGKQIPSGVEDGILTADEISRIDLSKNDIIVLSACETGLGDVDGVDGVLGLQKGLKKAGVNTILMSLWKVPDEETKILMTSFYRHYLSGESANRSLMFAQKELRENGKSPYYWAGFIVLD